MMTEGNASQIGQRFDRLRKAVQDAASQCGRDSEDISIVLVSKTVSADRILEAYQLGVREFGENRVQELLEKQPQLPSDTHWHFIGHLQTNKVKQVLPKVSMVQSLDRTELLTEIEKQAARLGLQEVHCLIQVNCSEEPTKFGFKMDEVEAFVETLKHDSPVKVKGLMSIGPNTDDISQIRQAFQSMKELQKRLKEKFSVHQWDVLSIGMSNDFQIAIEEGSTMIRVGSAVFGPRENHAK